MTVHLTVLKLSLHGHTLSTERGVLLCTVCSTVCSIVSNDCSYQWEIERCKSTLKPQAAALLVFLRWSCLHNVSKWILVRLVAPVKVPSLWNKVWPCKTSSSYTCCRVWLIAWSQLITDWSRLIATDHYIVDIFYSSLLGMLTHHLNLTKLCIFQNDCLWCSLRGNPALLFRLSWPSQLGGQSPEMALAEMTTDSYLPWKGLFLALLYHAFCVMHTLVQFNSDAVYHCTVLYGACEM